MNSTKILSKIFQTKTPIKEANFVSGEPTIRTLSSMSQGRADVIPRCMIVSSENPDVSPVSAEEDMLHSSLNKTVAHLLLASAKHSICHGLQVRVRFAVPIARYVPNR